MPGRPALRVVERCLCAVAVARQHRSQNRRWRCRLQWRAQPPLAWQLDGRAEPELVSPAAERPPPGRADGPAPARCAARLIEGVARAEQLGDAGAFLDEALVLARATGHTFITAAALHHLGMIAADARHDHPTARRLLTRSLALYRTLELPRYVVLLLIGLGDLARAEGDHTRAHEILGDGLAAMCDVGDTVGLSGALDTVAHLAADQRQGRPGRAAGRRGHDAARHHRHPTPARQPATPRPVARRRTHPTRPRRVPSRLGNGPGHDTRTGRQVGARTQLPETATCGAASLSMSVAPDTVARHIRRHR